MSYRKQTAKCLKLSLCLINLTRPVGLTPFLHCVQRLMYSAVFGYPAVCVFLWRRERKALTLLDPLPPVTENSLHNGFTKAGEFSNPCHLRTAADPTSKILLQFHIDRRKRTDRRALLNVKYNCEKLVQENMLLKQPPSCTESLKFGGRVGHYSTTPIWWAPARPDSVDVTRNSQPRFPKPLFSHYTAHSPVTRQIDPMKIS